MDIDKAVACGGVGSRVIRTLNGRDWPGTITGRPFNTGDGQRVRVTFDAGSSADIPTSELRPAPATP